ncbi:MAG: hypothetical protein NTU86_12175 [Burkholderiales bacterium]|nr:hypothetical protein [Burkholderiales bacterium]
MFKLDMQAIRENAKELLLTANPANAANKSVFVSKLATLAISNGDSCTSKFDALEAHRVAKELIAAAMRRCDQFNDSEAARAEMHQQCLELPPHLQRDLLEYFEACLPNIDASASREHLTNSLSSDFTNAVALH